ncbi:MAG: symmetrical bis(5'-nucleosyl)-tetraphosphatase [Rhodocyclaceae bacterium]|nr:symmetrical bis(5'-nucleosyl)-tetraphosphatase [Rhodocyclaceae bacterium]
MATYAIGDIQGCFGELKRLLEYIGFNEQRDRLWFVGDLVNRGPSSLEVLRFVRDLKEAAITVLGNHDLHLIMQAEGFGKTSREDTLAPILAAPDRDELMAWLRSQPLFHVENDTAMVHAGLLPSWTVEQAKDLAAEVSTALTSPHYHDFLAHLWGSEPDRWHDDLVGRDRLRVIVNAMTRMRFITKKGAMALRTPGSKAPPERAPAGCLPWYDAPKRASTSHTLIVGHWSALGLKITQNLLALDSGCLWGGKLTAVRLEDRRLFQISCRCQVEPCHWE